MNAIDRMFELLVKKVAKPTDSAMSSPDSPDLKEMDRVIDEQNESLNKKLRKTVIAENLDHLKLHRELSKYDKKDAYQYEILKYRRKYEGLKQEYKTKIEGIKETLKKFYVSKVEQKKDTIREVYIKEYSFLIKQSNRLKTELERKDKAIKLLQRMLIQ